MLFIEYKPPPGPWNKGKIVGPKPPLRPQEVWSIRIHLQMKARGRDLALFNLAIDSKLRGCDLVRLKVDDVAHGSIVQSRAKIIQQKTLRPVQFEITDQTRVSLQKMDLGGCLGAKRLPLSESTLRVSTSFDATVRANRRLLDQAHRARSLNLWHPLNAENEGFADLPANKKSPCSSASAWPRQYGKHYPIPRNRGR